ncbi:MAG: hypothetical protein R2827_11985 [Bdellovibrionales bacterium]
MRFLLENQSQKDLMNKNIMLPVIDGVVQGTEFAKLPKVKLLPIDKSLDFSSNKMQNVKVWLKSIGEDR